MAMLQGRKMHDQRSSGRTFVGVILEGQMKVSWHDGTKNIRAAVNASRGAAKLPAWTLQTWDRKPV